MQVPKFGEQRWSDFFDAYVAVHLYLSDVDWYFTIPKNKSDKVYKAETRWSHLREHKDGKRMDE